MLLAFGCTQAAVLNSLLNTDHYANVWLLLLDCFMFLREQHLGDPLASYW